MVIHHCLLGFNYTNRVEKNNIPSEYTKHIFINCNRLVLKLNYMFFYALVCRVKIKRGHHTDDLFVYYFINSR